MIMKKNHFKQIDVSTEPQLFFRFDKMLESKKAMGTSRHKAKEDGTEKNKIFSYNTYNTYRNTLYDFSHFVLDRHPNVKQPNQARKYVDEFLQSYQDKGASN